MEKIIIIDAPFSFTPAVFENYGLRVVSARQLTEDLLSWQLWQELDPWRTLLVFPGNGANLLRREIIALAPTWLHSWPYQEALSAKRLWVPGQPPEALVGRFGDSVYIGLKQVIVLDDVVSSGETCRQVYRHNYPYTPGADWLACTWVAQRSARLRGFKGLEALVWAGTVEQRAPINSLSTLIECPEICRVYAERNFPDRAQAFQEMIAAGRL
jgi:hypothetical protein